jgi:aldehyde:ferredoxin oxidoreductase
MPVETENEATESALKPPTAFSVNRYHVDLTTETVRFESVQCEDMEDVLGGIARATKLLADVEVDDAYDPAAPIVMNLGLLSGTRVMTGLRTYFHGYSPLKMSRSGKPGLMWSAGSGKFGTKLRGLGIDEVVFTGRASSPRMIHLTPSDAPEGPGGPANFDFLDASDLGELHVNKRILTLYERYPDAHFAVIGPAAQNYENVRFASIALSTENQLKSGDPKARFCGRGGYGGVLASKNLYAIAADGPNPNVRSRGLKDINKEVNLGKGSWAYRDDGAGGTWRQVPLQHENGVLPEYNFNPTGTDQGVALTRKEVEKGPYEIKAESCYLCGIKCHKNVYDDVDGEAGQFRTKVDYEPFILLSSNLGLYDVDKALDLVALVDELSMDSISLGVSLGHIMEWNKRNPDNQFVDGLSYGDYDAIVAAIQAVAEGRLPEVGEGVLRFAMRTESLEFAMQSKGVEFPAYVPHSNPGYPWALAGGHMSMKTFILVILERETGMDYWVDAITNRGPMFLLDDMTGMCKFAALDPVMIAEALGIAAGLEVTADDLRGAVDRTWVRGYTVERRVGFEVEDYALPAEAHQPAPASKLPYFNTPEFFDELRTKVIAVLDERAEAYGYV